MIIRIIRRWWRPKQTKNNDWTNKRFTYIYSTARLDFVFLQQHVGYAILNGKRTTGFRTLHRALGDVHLHQDVMQTLQQLLVVGRIFGHGGRQLIAASNLGGRRADCLPVETRYQPGNEFGIEIDFDLLLFGDLRPEDVGVDGGMFLGVLMCRSYSPLTPADSRLWRLSGTWMWESCTWLVSWRESIAGRIFQEFWSQNYYSRIMKTACASTFFSRLFVIDIFEQCYRFSILVIASFSLIIPNNAWKHAHTYFVTYLTCFLI